MDDLHIAADLGNHGDWGEVIQKCDASSRTCSG